MEKSIESIWKNGFLQNDALVVPKLNNLYNQKSTHIIDKFKRMYAINQIAIVAFAFILLPISFIAGMPYIGVAMFVLFISTLAFGHKFKKRLNEIDKGQNSFEYLSSFESWLKDMIEFNSKLSRYIYPYLFLSLVLGFWFRNTEGNVQGEELLNHVMTKYPDTYVVFGIPLIGIIGVISIVVLLAIFGGRIAKWDINIVYGRIIEKLDGLMAEMKELSE